jgi:hypothetical protein
MRKFDLEAAKKGEPVCTRDGLDYEIKHIYDGQSVWKIKGNFKNRNETLHHTGEGRYNHWVGLGHSLDHPLDLFMKNDVSQEKEETDTFYEQQMKNAAKQFKKDMENLFKSSHKNDMKITPKTTIEEILEDGDINGYYVEDVKIDKNYGKLPGDYILNIKLKIKKPEKNFEWYVKEYLLLKHHICENKTDDIVNWSFEYKIGILRFICDDLKISFKDVLFNLCGYKVDFEIKSFEILFKICPKEFITSILK